jgi:3-dehydroquinate dehydratase-2
MPAILRRSGQDSVGAADYVSLTEAPVARILLLNGPNLNLLGEREPGVYGLGTLTAIEQAARAQATANGHACDTLQSNSELAWIERLHSARTDGTAFIIANPGAFTHQSVAIRDALAAAGLPFIEVHLSNVHAREPFRHRSLFSDRAVGVIAGLGPDGYEYAMNAAIRHLAQEKVDGIQTGI